MKNEEVERQTHRHIHRQAQINKYTSTDTDKYTQYTISLYSLSIRQS